MKIVWDRPKREKTLNERRLDFADVPLEFFETAVIVGARKGRFKAVGFLNGRMMSIIFRPLGTEALSIISMRRASVAERTAYAKARPSSRNS
jgi:uncharacterized DUF497 family protein